MHVHKLEIIMTQRAERKCNYVTATGHVEGDPCNYYGNVSVWRDDGKCWMGVENYDGTRGYEISEAFYLAFVAEWDTPAIRPGR